jgi:hypothetical protein
MKFNIDLGEIITKSWKITWKFKVLWIFGILSGCVPAIAAASISIVAAEVVEAEETTVSATSSSPNSCASSRICTQRRPSAYLWASIWSSSSV